MGKGYGNNLLQNKVNAINRHGFIQWHFVLTDHNPSDVGTRGT